MILFSAEAILASSSSKFCIWILLTDDEDFNSSTESTISTSLIHVCPKYLAYRCGSAFPKDGITFHQDLDEVGKTLVDWQRGISTANWFSILKLLWITHTIYFILQFLNLACEFKDSILIFDQFSPRNCIEMFAVLPSHWDFSREVHEDPDFVPMIVHEEVVDLVEVVYHMRESD